MIAILMLTEMKQQQISLEEKLLGLNDQLEEIIAKAKALEYDYGSLIAKVHPTYHECALNLTHYLAFRSFDIDKLQFSHDSFNV
jgi:hypothetical protein